VRLRTIGLALAVTCLVAVGGPALAQIEGVPPGIPMPPAAGPMPPQGGFMPQGPMGAPGGQMMMPPGGFGAMPGGPMMGGPMPGGPMMGGYPGMPPVMPYPPPLGGNGCLPCGGCGDPSCCDEGCCGGCPTFGRYGGCEEECCCGEPDGTAHWRARVETVLLTFKLPDQPQVLSTGSLNDTAGIRNLDFDRELNVRLSLEAKLPCDQSLEIVFLGFVDWSATEAVVDPATLTSPYQTFTAGTVVPYDGASEHDYAYRSRLLTCEFNYWMPGIKHSLFQSSCVVGVRYLRIEEDFDYDAFGTFLGNAISGSTHINAENNIAAVQLGGMAWVPVARQVSVRFDGKAGAGYNFASQTTDIATLGNPAGDTAYSEHAASNQGAYFAEVSTVFTWQLNCYVALYAGYQALWMDRLVLAPENFNSTFPTDGFRPVLIDDTGNRFYHGVLGGLEVTW
jgi:hypothetical protein